MEIGVVVATARVDVNVPSCLNVEPVNVLCARGKDGMATQWGSNRINQRQQASCITDTRHPGWTRSNYSPRAKHNDGKGMGHDEGLKGM